MAFVGEAIRSKALLKEAYMLSSEIAKMDKQIDKAVEEKNGKLANWIENHENIKKIIEFGWDKVKDKAIEKLFEELFKLLKITKFANVPATILTGAGIPGGPSVPGILSSSGREDKRANYLDGAPNEFTRRYEEKKKRLQIIYAELFVVGPPTAIDIHQNACRIEACWQSR